VEANREGTDTALTIHNLALAAGGWSAWRSGRFFRSKDRLGRPWGLCGQHRKSHSQWNSITRPSSLYRITIPTELSQLPVSLKGVVICCTHAHMCMGRGIRGTSASKGIHTCPKKLIQQTKKATGLYYKVQCENCHFVEVQKFTSETQQQKTWYDVCHHSLYNGTQCYLYITFPQLVLKTH